jgi:hypothetical protein
MTGGHVESWKDIIPKEDFEKYKKEITTANKIIDKGENQDSSSQHLHAMQGKDETKELSILKANAALDAFVGEAKKSFAKGDKKEGYFIMALAGHVAQDSNPEGHEKFQKWDTKSLDDITTHVKGDIYPKEGSERWIKNKAATKWIYDLCTDKNAEMPKEYFNSKGELQIPEKYLKEQSDKFNNKQKEFNFDSLKK